MREKYWARTQATDAGSGQGRRKKVDKDKKHELRAPPNAGQRQGDGSPGDALSVVKAKRYHAYHTHWGDKLFSYMEGPWRIG